MSDPNSPLPTSTLEYEYPLPEPVGPPPSERYWLHALLLLGTVFTTLVVGARLEFNFRHNLPALMAGDGLIPFFPLGWVLAHPSRLLLGIPFSATLPFFIPAPTVIGTLGAVIRIKAPIRTRAALFDIGVAGPIAGFVVALGSLVVAEILSKPLAPMPASDLELGLPLIFRLIHHAVGAASVAGLPLARVYLHPMAVAAWVGMYATALNLLPSGQLDGGHMIYALMPRAHRAISWITVLGLAYLGAQKVPDGNDLRFNYAWWFWGGLIAAMNILTFRQEQAPETPPIPANRWLLAAFGLVMLVLTFTISPFRTN